MSDIRPSEVLQDFASLPCLFFVALPSVERNSGNLSRSAIGMDDTNLKL